MKRSFVLYGCCLGLAIIYYSTPGFCQVQEDSVMLAHSERWTVKRNKGMSGLSKPEFGPFITIGISKVDSPMIKNKKKEGAYLEGEISSEGTDMNHIKLMTIEKTKFSKLQIGTGFDIAEAVFATSSLSKEKRQTVLGSIISKNDEGSGVVVSYNRDVAGMISFDLDSTQWYFFIDNFTSGGRQTEESSSPTASISGGYLKNLHDSIYIQTYSTFSADMVLINKKEEHLAALKFKQKPFYIWIRNDQEESYKKAIGVFFAVIISIKDQ